MGVGTLAWGEPAAGFITDPKVRPKAGQYNPAELCSAYETLLEAGISFLDTSEMYGQKLRAQSMSAEHLLGTCVENSRQGTPMIATKYTPSLLAAISTGGGLRGGRGAVVDALVQSLERLGVPFVELYQVQGSVPYVGGYKALAEGLARARDRGLCRHVGVCNFSASQIRSFKEALDKFGLPLASSQFEFSLINQDRLLDGTLAECQAMGVTCLASAPLGRGLASGVYTAADPTGGKGGLPLYNFKQLEPLLGMHEALEQVAKKATARLKANPQLPADEASTTQVSLAYVQAKGMVPLPGVKTQKQAREVAGCLGWKLTEEEVEILDQAYAEYKQTTGGTNVKRAKVKDQNRRGILLHRGRKWKPSIDD